MEKKFTDNNFKQEVLESDIPVVVDFYADWCGPCKMMGPMIEAAAVKYEGKVNIGKLNVDDNPDMAQKYRVMSIPTILFIKGGEVVDKTVGGIDESVLEDKIKALL